MVGDIFNQGTWKVTLKIYNLLQPPSIFLILSMVPAALNRHQSVRLWLKIRNWYPIMQ